GRERAFIIYPSNKDMKLPSDLAGVTVATFEHHPDRELRELKAAVSAGCYEMINAVKQLGKIAKTIPISEHTLASTLHGLMRNISTAMKIEHLDFRGEIVFHCREWHSMSKDWAQGKVVVRQNYEKLLANIYRSAKNAIFSTSIPQYQKTW